jgi:hypothetical protein
VGKLTTEVFNESCCDGGEGKGQCLTPGKMTRSVGELNVTQAAIPVGDFTSVPVSVTLASEIRTVDPLTGGEKGSKIERYDLIPPEMPRALATHYGVGARKYADRNWERGYKWGLSYAALMRHLEAWRSGETHDPETGSNHLIAVIWHATALFVFQTRGLGTNDLFVVK